MRGIMEWIDVKKCAMNGMVTYILKANMIIDDGIILGTIALRSERGSATKKKCRGRPRAAASASNRALQARIAPLQLPTRIMYQADLDLGLANHEEGTYAGTAARCLDVERRPTPNSNITIIIPFERKAGWRHAALRCTSAAPRFKSALPRRSIQRFRAPEFALASMYTRNLPIGEQLPPGYRVFTYDERAALPRDHTTLFPIHTAGQFRAPRKEVGAQCSVLYYALACKRAMCSVLCALCSRPLARKATSGSRGARQISGCVHRHEREYGIMCQLALLRGIVWSFCVINFDARNSISYRQQRDTRVICITVACITNTMVASPAAAAERLLDAHQLFVVLDRVVFQPHLVAQVHEIPQALRVVGVLALDVLIPAGAPSSRAVPRAHRLPSKCKVALW
eukprot:gene10908-biopygen5564